MIEWFNETLLPSWEVETLHAAGKKSVKRQFILDGMKIEVPAHLKRKYEGAGTVENDDEPIAMAIKSSGSSRCCIRRGKTSRVSQNGG